MIIITIFLNLSYSQSADFEELTKKTIQSYSDRGYTLINHTKGKITLAEPIVTPILDFDYKKYYIVLVQLEGCLYCSYQLFFVDTDNNLIPVEYEIVIENNIRQALLKFTCDSNKNGKYVVLLDSDLPYYGNVYVFRK